MSFKYYDKLGSAPMKYLVISDLHLGFEYNLVEKGIQINSKFFTQEIVSEVNAIIRSCKPQG
ncbi:MAG: hypothetical protein ACRD8Z_16555, partial [Nitrososphaeraceae archaeon]